jgi:hypothetical protein
MTDVSELVAFLRSIHAGEKRQLDEWLSKIPLAADALETLAGENASAHREALQLAKALHRRRYRHVLQWEPTDTAAGIVSQIDNMTAGLGERLDAAESRLAKLAPVVEAARDLMRSGYDGPFIGEVCEPLFSALANLEATNV